MPDLGPSRQSDVIVILFIFGKSFVLLPKGLIVRSS